MKFFVTGGTGFLGSHLIRQLIANGDEVIALVYEPDREPTVRSWGADTVVGGFEHGVLSAAMGSCDGVFHVAGYVSLDDPGGKKSTAINVDGVRVVGTAAVDAGVKRLVHTSSLVTIGGTRDGRTLTEDSPFECDTLSLPYIDTKREGESIAFSLQNRGLEVVICNPSGLIGPDDRWGSEANEVFDLYRRYGVPVVPAVRNNWVDVRDVAAGHIAAMHGGRTGERYFLGAENTTLKELLGRLDEALGRPQRRRLEFGWPWTFAIGQAAALVQRDPQLTPNVARFLRLAFWVSNEKAKRELGYRCRPAEETLRDTYHSRQLLVTS